MPDHLTDMKKIGLTTPEIPMPALTDEPRIPSFSCQGSADGIPALDIREASGLGISRCETTARIKAHAECLEAICLLNGADHEQEKRAFRPGSEDFDPAAFVARAGSKRCSQVTMQAQHAEMAWRAGTDLFGGGDVMLPGQLVVLDTPLEDEFQLRPERISTGTAFGPAGTGMALRSGLLELIERDAAFNAFYQRRELPEIVDMPAQNAALVEYLKRYRLEPHIFDATSEVAVPVVVAIVLDPTGLGPAVTAGAAAAVNYQEAIDKALLESLQGRSAFRIWQASEELVDPRPEDIENHQDRAIYWSRMDRIGELDFWLQSGSRVRFDDLNHEARDIDWILQALARQGCRLMSVDITLPQVRAAGFEVIRVLSPDLYPGHARESANCLGSFDKHARRGTAPLPHPF